MNYVIKCCLLVVAQWAFFSLNAQDLKSAILRMQEVYKGRHSLHVMMEVEAYEDGRNEKKPFYSQTVDIKKDQNNYWCRFGDNEVYMSQERVLILDHQTKEVIHTTPDTTTSEAFHQLVGFGLDSILSLYKQPVDLGVINGLRHYQIIQKNGPVERVRIGVNSTTGLLGLLTYQYRTGDLVTIRFKLFDVSPAFSETTFDEKQFVVQHADGLKLSEHYRGYTLFDQTQKKERY